MRIKDDAPMDYSDENISWAYNRTAGRCFYCGQRIVLKRYDKPNEQGAWTIDNLMPIFHVVVHNRDNFVPACMSCTTRKDDPFPHRA